MECIITVSSQSIFVVIFYGIVEKAWSQFSNELIWECGRIAVVIIRNVNGALVLDVISLKEIRRKKSKEAQKKEKKRALGYTLKLGYTLEP
ncbi:hypothetical protein Ahy_A06g028368 isoform B [Arachis hypogaea]|uniref:Uncharacterized protein n=1 Tax=Arachis hypogaea TaxID=3818 RepID=A0A445CQV5_ARAHY|nr:hypothetical protein Ahy_A06g028368 isoform B [Arachis hypogaea]